MVSCLIVEPLEEPPCLEFLTVWPESSMFTGVLLGELEECLGLLSPSETGTELLRRGTESALSISYNMFFDSQRVENIRV